MLPLNLCIAKKISLFFYLFQYAHPSYGFFPNEPMVPIQVLMYPHNIFPTDQMD